MSSAEIGLVGQETEVTAKPRRRQFTAEFKRKVLAEVDACSKAGEIQADQSPCAGVPSSWTGSAELATYLGIPAAHAARLAPFLAVFSSAAPFTAADNWATPGDEELYWPAGLR